MIEPERQLTALHALHSVLIEARAMARRGASSADLEFVMDWAEVLPMYIASPFDQTKEFRHALDALADRFPMFKLSMKTFDNIAGVEATRRRQLAAAARLATADAT